MIKVRDKASDERYEVTLDGELAGFAAYQKTDAFLVRKRGSLSTPIATTSTTGPLDTPVPGC